MTREFKGEKELEIAVSFYGSLLSHNHCFLTLPIIYSSESAAKRNRGY